VDILIPEQPTLKEISELTGLKGFTVAFVLARTKGDCTAWWGGQAPLEYEDFISQIREFQAIGGQVIVSTGGAAAPYIEAACCKQIILLGLKFL
jgi:chitinase